MKNHALYTPKPTTRTFWAALLIVCCSMFSACSSDPCPACVEANEAIQEELADWEDPNTHKLVDALHALQGGAATASDSINLYIDRSGGMKYHFPIQSPCLTLFYDLFNSLQSQEQWVNCFGLDSKKKNNIYRFPFDDMNQVFQRPASVFYNGASSPLDEAVARIVQDTERQSVFVTDGEYAVKVGSNAKVDQENGYASKAFGDWLAAGNDLDFIIQEIPEKQRSAVDSMRMFFIFFTPKSKAAGNHNALQTFLQTSSLNAGSYTHLSFSGNPYAIRQKNKLDLAEKKMGLNSFLADQIEIDSRSSDDNTRMTHMHLEGFKPTFDEFVTGLAAKDYDDYYADMEKKYDLEKGSLLHDLWIQNKAPHLKPKTYRMQVRDLDLIQAQYLSWQSCQSAKSVTDEETSSKVWCQGYGYECQSTQPECAPTFSAQSPNIGELLDVELAKTKGDEAHLRVVPSRHYDEILLGETMGLLLEIYPEDIGFEHTQGMQKLMWPDKRGGTNDKNMVIYNSMVQALIRQSKGLAKQPIYTYYITFQVPTAALE